MAILRNISLTFIFAVTTASAWAANPYQKIAKDLAPALVQLKNPRVAVLALPYHNGLENSGSAMVAERLITQLAQKKGLRIIERNLLRTLLEENKLSETGVIDSESAKKAGKILGVDVVVSGTLIDLGESRTEVNARAMDAQSGKILAVSQTIVQKTWPDSSTLRRRTEPVYHEPEEQIEDNAPIEIGYPVGRPGPGIPRGR